MDEWFGIWQMKRNFPLESQLFPVTQCQSPQGKFILPLYTPLPSHSKALLMLPLVPVNTQPHPCPHFVHPEAPIPYKVWLLYHLAIREFFSSLDAGEKAEALGLAFKSFVSNS